MHWPNYENLESLDWNSMPIKLAISVAMVGLSDLGSSYFVYCKGFPLSQCMSKAQTSTVLSASRKTPLSE